MPTLRDDQKAGITHILTRFEKQKGFCLADKAGLGKTCQAIEVMKTCIDRYKKPAQIIAPAYLVYNWLDELELWGVPRSDISVIDSGRQQIKHAAIYLSSYNQAVSGMIRGQMIPVEKSILICDEAHTFRSWNTLRGRYIMGTRQNKKIHYQNFSEKVLLLTGTPVVNGIEDVYNIFSRLAPEKFSKFLRQTFMTYFSANFYSTPWGMKYEGVGHTEELRALLKDYILCRSIDGDLPPLLQKEIHLPTSKADLQRLLTEESEFLHDHGVAEKDVLALKSMKNDEHFSTIRQRVAITKVPAAVRMTIELLQDGERPLVYCYHKAVQVALYEALTKKCGKKRIEIINGETPPKKRHELVKAYQAGDIDILLPTIGALKEGVNITAGRVIIFIELPYTPAEIEQVQARLHRTGQTSAVHSYLVMYNGGIDKHIAGILREKNDVIQQLITVTESDPFMLPGK